MPGTQVWRGVAGARTQRNRIGRPRSGSRPARHATRMAARPRTGEGLAGFSGAALALTPQLLTMPEDTCLTSPILAGREDFHDK